jgi:hypothetical protein
MGELEGAPGSIGRCRRHAPVVSVHTEHSLSLAMIAVWPLTQDGEWCGEWRRK